MAYHYTNFSRGWIVEIVNGSRCNGWLLLPGENLWSHELRGFLYIMALFYIFLGVAIASDIFMGSIEVITSKRRTVVKWDEEKGHNVEKEVLIWNATVANLSLMALGSSAPEILLAVIETSVNLGHPNASNDLGTFTIIGSAAFNLLIITAICIVSVPSPQSKTIKQLGVFLLTSAWSIFAYGWLLVVVVGVSPGVIEVWEAWVTFAFFPILLLMAYAQDNNWWCHKHKSSAVAVHDENTNIRVIGPRNHSIIQGMSKELSAIEREKNGRLSRTSALSQTEREREDLSSLPGYISEPSLRQEQRRWIRNLYKDATSPSVTVVNTDSPSWLARARFRHAAVSAMLGGRKHTKFSETALSTSKRFGPSSSEELHGKIIFASPSYSVLESSGVINIDVLFFRNAPAPVRSSDALFNGSALDSSLLSGNGVDKSQHKGIEKSPETHTYTGTVKVDYETREGSAKIDRDFKCTQGTLVFEESDYRKSISVPIINDKQYTADVDFYVILKNVSGEASLSEPNITRITIIDDDQPGEFEFEDARCYADMEEGVVNCRVTRGKGCDGSVKIEYSTIDGTARGGKIIGNEIDYVSAEGEIEFNHGETSKIITVAVNKESRRCKNFMLSLKNPSPGAKIGKLSVTMCCFADNDGLASRLADILDDNDRPVTWGENFRNAMTLECEVDEFGEKIPLKWIDYLLHFSTFFWKILFAFIPPSSCLGAWPAFAGSLGFIGILTFIIEELGNLLSCVVGLELSVAGITIIAIGTSLPDTFASRTAALHDEGADAAIGNVTGSNCVNVFLGLGLPWVISSTYHLVKGTPYTTRTDNMVASVVIFTVIGLICILLLLFRRRFVGGELGGKNPVVKWGSSVFLFVLWVIYIVLSSLKAYKAPLPW